ncbi:MAG: class I SAM-dependent methyltransferase [Planctomycetes bacterium]|nr:class I SAM-dependent methyltransferase [Planctomycetota bacterium]
MRISVIINSYNEGPDLERTIRNFTEKAGGAVLSFVVIADGTSDGSADSLDDKVVVLKTAERIGCGQAKHLGVNYALEHQSPQFIFHSDGHGRIISGTLWDIAREGMERSPCVITPAVGPLGCKHVVKCKQDGRHAIKGKCEVDCPDYEDPEGMPRNCYHGGMIGWKRSDYREHGVFCDYTLGKPKDKTSVVQTVNPSAFGYTPETLKRIGGWNRYPGVWGSQEAGISLRCWFTKTPIYCTRQDYVCLLHRYRSWNHPSGEAVAPYTIPLEHRNVNWRYMHRMMFDDDTWEKVWAPWFKRLHNDPKADKLLEECEWLDEQLADFRKLKQRSDDEFFQEVLGFDNPGKMKMREGATRALYCISAGIGNALMCIPAIKALSELSKQPVDVWDCGLNQSDAKDLLASQSFIRKVIHKEEVPDVTWYKYIIGSYWASGPMFVPIDSVAFDVDRGWRTQHEVECNMAAVRKAGYVGVTPTAELQSWQQGDYGLPKDYIAVGVDCAAHEAKKYPHWEILCKRIKDSGVNIVFLGGAGADEPWMDSLGINLCGKTTLASAAGVLELARMYVGLDNGLSHMAAAVRTPMLVLYGPSSERKNRPWSQAVRVIRSGQYSCAPCWDKPSISKCDCQNQGKRPCMIALDPAYLADEILYMLDAPAWACGDTWPLYLSRKQVMTNMNAEPLQAHEEFSALIDLLRDEQIKNVVEIGSADGGWLGIIAGALGGKLNLFSIDPDPNSFFDPENCPEDHPRGFGSVSELLVGNGHTVKHIPLRSDDPAATNHVLAWTGNYGNIDLLHIDGNHSMSACLRDWEMYKDYVRPGGFIVFHDVVNCKGVKAVFEDIQSKEEAYRVWQFRAFTSERPRGIGVIQRPLIDATK